MTKSIYLKLFSIHMLIGFISTISTWRAPFQNIIGMSDSDLYPHIWGYWRWFRQWESGGWNIWSNVEPFLNAPHTGELYHVDWLNAAIVGLLQSIHIPLVLSINLMLSLQWIILGMGLLSLGKRLQLTFWGLMFILIAIDTSVFVQRFVLQSAVFERMNLGTLCLYLSCLFALCDHRTLNPWKWSIGGITCFGLTTLGSWHYAMFLLIASILIGGWTVIQQRTRIITQRLSALALGCGVVAWPISRRAKMSLSDESIIEHHAISLWDWHSPIELLNDFRFTDLWWPNIYHTQGFDILEESAFIGLLYPILIAMGFYRNRDKIGGVQPLLLLCFLIFTVLALGPQIRLTTELEIFSPVFYGFAGVIPYFLTLEVPWEYSIMGILFGALLIGSQHQRLSYPWIPSALLILQQIWALPSIIDSTTPTSLHSEVFRVLQQTDGNIFDYPFRSNHTGTQQQSPHHRYLWWGTQHERPIAHGIQQSWVHRDDFWREVNKSGPQWTLVRQSCRAQLCRNPNELKHVLQQQGFTRFVVHTDLLSPSRKHVELREWTKVFGNPLFQNDHTTIYSLDQN